MKRRKPPTRMRSTCTPSKPPDAARPEAEILAELQAVCAQPGYLHALAYLCFRDNMIFYSEELIEQDMHAMRSPERLSRTEISTLVGLMLKSPIDWALPPPHAQQRYVEDSDRLLGELHQALSAAFSLKDVIAGRERGEEINPFDSGAVMREPIFYGAESAYNFQYLDFAVQRYAADAVWLENNVGFTIEQACAVAEAIDRVNGERLEKLRDELIGLHPDQWTMLPAFTATPAEIAPYAGLNPEMVERILLAFTVPEGELNERFVGLQDFNVVAAKPLLQGPAGKFVCLQSYTLAESIYESPFFWMLPDKAYQPQRDKHRGEFTENFVAERLAAVFGADCVLTNVEIWQGKTKVGEIDVLVLWADRAIIVQAKSKRLTIEARKGNDQIIRDDFKKSVQDAYEQGLDCAQFLGVPGNRLARVDGTDVELPEEVTEIFMFCVVSDHYPALSFQTRQFLKTREVPRVRAALVTDVFLIDVLTELLATPLYFLSFVSRRARYAEQLLAAQELTILGYHLKKNLWFEEKLSIVHIAEDFTSGVDVAMAARRRGLPGLATPEGILTRYEGTALGRILSQIRARPEPAVLDQGFQLLEMGSEALDDLSRMIDRQAQRSAQDGQPHSLALMFPDRSGFTALISGEADAEAMRNLSALCVRRKYKQKADLWFGMCLMPGDSELRFGLRLAAPWTQDIALDAATGGMPEAIQPKVAHEHLARRARGAPKVGRNDPCPCGTGKKSKKCCGR
ncbi:SEC-C metal-binding domain-containing protein [Luteimonas sp. SMYT11W]|uniref:SEC-C metal-binding domain-containing protein n=1 Tax=Luteimonas flava TaxID=3115822 RepID=A0ABU7WG14_9GAMM